MITMRNIIREGHPNLTKKSSEIIFPLSREDIKLAHDLMDFVVNSQDEVISEKYNLRPGVGLAAVQVNKLKRMFAMHLVDFDQKQYSYVVINPTIVNRSNEITYLPTGEGCLSVDRETEGLTPRYYSIRATGYYLDLTNDTLHPLDITLEGYPAIVFQHEYDHLDGIMFTTKLYPTIPNAFPLYEIKEQEDDSLAE